MITETQVLADLVTDERQQVEFKERFIRPADLAEAMMAFAHAEGGTIYLGVAETPGPPHPSGKIRRVTKEDYDNIQRAAQDVLAPPISGVVAYEIDVQGHTVVAVVVPRSTHLHQHTNGKILIRRGSENVALRGDALLQLLVERESPAYDERLIAGATLRDLDPARVEWYLHRAVEERRLPVDLSLPMEENLIRLRVVGRQNGEAVPNAAGLLLFGRDPQRFIPHSVVRAARFQGTTPVNFIDRMDCSGTLAVMIDEAERFVRRNTRVAARITGFERHEITEYPYPAIREALANAVAHRDYWRRGADVRLSIFDDRIEVQSPGRLPLPLTLDTLGREHVLRNPLIADLLYRIRYIERWNTGIQRMRQAMRNHGLEEPSFEEVGHEFHVSFWGPGSRVLELIPEGGVTDLEALGLNERQVGALHLMVNEGRELTRQQYQEMFGIPKRTAVRDLNGLITAGQTRRIGRGPGVRYVAA